MAATDTHGGIFQRLDQLHEFDREPVTEGRLCGGSYFAANFVGEHVAATEFVIGALFVTFGASARDVLVGLLLGNLLAVLSWALVCAPIAVETRLTLYWYLRKIAGPAMTAVYNVLNAALYCVLAGAMITVSASAVRIPFGIPEQTHWYPHDVRFVLVVLGVGAVVVTLAVLGFKRLAQFASVCSPWMLLMFVAGGVAMLPTLGQIASFRDFWKVANERIWTGHTLDGSPPLGFWHVAAFAWICNLAMHLGLSDMALLRYAKRAAYGFYSALGMYLGHYLAWICAGIMGAAVAAVQAKPLVQLDSGTVAFQSLGVVGALTVVIAGWTTSNPTLYRAGLALQVVTPGWPRWLVTLLAGTVTTLIACFPFVFTKLLDFVAIYGIMLAPVGAIVVAEHWIFPRLGFTQYWCARRGLLLNWPALVSWGVGLALAATCWGVKLVTTSMAADGTLAEPVEILHEYFLVIPVWIVTTACYLVLAAVAGARRSLPALPQETAAQGSLPGDGPPAEPPGRLYYVSGIVALVCLALCVVLPLLVFAGGMEAPLLKRLLIWVTLVYFAAAVTWIGQREKRKSTPATPFHRLGTND
jgi:NCS1 family nucleobase:cation symporter-1